MALRLVDQVRALAPPAYFEYSATCFSAFFVLSPLVQMKQVYDSKGACLGAVNPNTMILLFFSCSLWAAWGVFLPMSPAIPGNLLGLCCGTCYLLFCWGHVRLYQCGEPLWSRRALAGTIAAFVLAAGMTAYAAISQTTASHVGGAAMLFSVCLFAAPLTVVAQVVREGSSQLLPPAQCLMQFLNCSVWLVVGLNTSAIPVIACNALGLLLATVQLGLIALYPQRDRRGERKDERCMSGAEGEAQARLGIELLRLPEQS